MLREYGPEYRGLETKAPVAVGEVLLRVPSRLVITIEMGRACALGRTVLAAAEVFAFCTVVTHCSQKGELAHKVTGHQYLAIFLLEQLKHRSTTTFGPWLDVLPQSFRFMPTFWPDDHFKHAQGRGPSCCRCDCMRVASRLPRFAKDKRVELKIEYKNFQTVR